MHSKEDQSLVRRVQLTATGANIHRVNEYLTLYRSAAGLANYRAQNDRDRIERMRLREFVKKIEQLLRVFCLSGYLPQRKPPWTVALARAPTRRKTVFAEGDRNART